MESVDACWMDRSSSPPPVAAGPAPAGPILVVDDDRDNVEIVRRLLGLRRYETLAAHGGEECLRILAARSVDLLVLDLDMPRVSGLDVLRTVGTARAATPPVVLLSASHEETLRAAALGFARTSFVSKPVNRLELYRRVECALGRSAASA